MFLLSEKVSDLSEVGFFILGYIPDIVAGAKYQKCELKYEIQTLAVIEVESPFNPSSDRPFIFVRPKR